MKPLETLLNSIPKPKVTVPRYRQDLRQRLLNSPRYPKNGVYKYKKKFYLSMSLASAFAIIIALFVAMPILPHKVHYALLSDQELMVSLNTAADREQVSGTIYDSKQFETQQDQAAFLKEFYSTDVDEAFVRMLAEGQLKKKAVNIKPISPSEFYAINRFRLDDGKDVVVYTQVPSSLVSTRESF